MLPVSVFLRLLLAYQSLLLLSLLLLPIIQCVGDFNDQDEPEDHITIFDSDCADGGDDSRIQNTDNHNATRRAFLHNTAGMSSHMKKIETKSYR